MKHRFQGKKANKKFNFKFINNFIKYKEYIRNFSYFFGKLFSILLTAYLIILFIEIFFENLFKNFFNLNTVLTMLVVSGSFYTISNREEKIELEKYEIKRKDILFIIFLGIIGSVLIWIKIQEYGPISYYISIISGFFMIIFLYYLLKGE